jgi:hypothetical protein
MINDKVLKEKALEIAKVANIVDFKESNGYLKKYKQRNKIIFTSGHGEANSVDVNVVKRWLGNQLKDHIHLVNPININNGDELGLFWRMQPISSYVIKDSVCKFGKQSKDRMTIFESANMMGDKLPLIIIGKSNNPRQIYTVRHLDFHYYFNATSWMNEIVFFDYIQKLNVEMIKQKKSVIMFIDNCKAHLVNISFSNVKIVFLPANTTSVLQQMDAGVI